jgi:hypothetical protein
MLLAHKQARMTQPYRRAGGRGPGLTLDAMLRGGSSMGNPMDAQRGAMKARGRRRKRRDLASWLLEP